jgi:predicted naringenin-chalcone synthase
MQPMSFIIEGIGTAVPQHSIKQADAATFAMACCESDAEKRHLVPALYRRSGVKTRHSVILKASTNGEPAQQDFYRPMDDTLERGPTTARRMQEYACSAAQLAIGASADALSKAGIIPSEITHLVTVSCSGFSAPGFDIALINELGLPASISRTHIGFMGCHGALNGLRVAKAYAEANPAARVLLCAVELCSLHHQYGWNPNRVVSNALFADGAAAVVGRASQEHVNSKWRLAACGSLVLPDTEDLMSWCIGDHGFEMSLSPRVPDTIRETLRPWLEQWLAEQHMSIGEIGSWAIHPGGPRILDACAEAAHLDSEALKPSRSVLANYGNMSSPTVLFILNELRAADGPRPCVMLAFGPGLTIEIALVR